jgi:SAM-dependent methyltransferase
MFKDLITICPLCGNGNPAPCYTIDKYEIKFSTSICRGCGFIFMNPPIDEKTLKSLYSEDYFKGKADYSYIDEREIKKYSTYVWDKRIKVINRYIKEGNFLDIGCSFGGLLESASQFYTPYGIEASDYAHRHASSIFGSNIHHGTIEDHPFKEKFFSVITMIELIEHLPEPRFAIEESYRLLKDKGLLVIQTANMAGKQAEKLSRDYEYFMPGHISYFTMSNLKQSLLNTGFTRVKVFYPVEFGLLPKLLKSRGSFRSLGDYKAWFRITSYHLKSKIHAGNFAMTSSMVIYAFKQ